AGPLRFDLQIVPTCIARSVVCSPLPPEFESYLRQRDSPFVSTLSLHDALPIFAVGHHFHTMHSEVVESGPAKSGDLRSAAGRHVAVLANLATVLTTGLAALIGEKDIFGSRLVENPQRAPRGRANTGFGDAVDGA